VCRVLRRALLTMIVLFIQWLHGYSLSARSSLGCHGLISVESRASEPFNTEEPFRQVQIQRIRDG
jgi:hypothetical protein